MQRSAPTSHMDPSAASFDVAASRVEFERKVASLQRIIQQRMASRSPNSNNNNASDGPLLCRLSPRSSSTSTALRMGVAQSSASPSPPVDSNGCSPSATAASWGPRATDANINVDAFADYIPPKRHAHSPNINHPHAGTTAAYDNAFLAGSGSPPTKGGSAASGAPLTSEVEAPPWLANVHQTEERSMPADEQASRSAPLRCYVAKDYTDTVGPPSALSAACRNQCNPPAQPPPPRVRTKQESPEEARRREERRATVMAYRMMERELNGASRWESTLRGPSRSSSAVSRSASNSGRSSSARSVPPPPQLSVSCAKVSQPKAIFGASEPDEASAPHVPTTRTPSAQQTRPIVPSRGQQDVAVNKTTREHAERLASEYLRMRNHMAALKEEQRPSGATPSHPKSNGPPKKVVQAKKVTTQRSSASRTPLRKLPTAKKYVLSSPSPSLKGHAQQTKKQPSKSQPRSRGDEKLAATPSQDLHLHAAASPISPSKVQTLMQQASRGRHTIESTAEAKQFRSPSPAADDDNVVARSLTSRGGYEFPQTVDRAVASPPPPLRRTKLAFCPQEQLPCRLPRSSPAACSAMPQVSDELREEQARLMGGGTVLVGDSGLRIPSRREMERAYEQPQPSVDGALWGGEQHFGSSPGPQAALHEITPNALTARNNMRSSKFVEERLAAPSMRIVASPSRAAAQVPCSADSSDAILRRIQEMKAFIEKTI